MTGQATVRLELAVGRRVVGIHGKSVGRLEEIRAAGDWTIEEYHIGTAALLERLSVTTLSLFGITRHGRGYSARWDQVDISDPRHPRLTCAEEELAKLGR